MRGHLSGMTGAPLHQSVRRHRRRIQRHQPENVGKVLAAIKCGSEAWSARFSNRTQQWPMHLTFTIFEVTPQADKLG